MADIYEIPDVEEEHQYCDIILPDDEPGNRKPHLTTKTGNNEPKPGISSGNDASKGDNSTKVFQHIVQFIHILLTLALVGISVYLLQMPKPDVSCQRDQECQSFDTVLDRLTAAEFRIDEQNATLQDSMTKATSQKERVINGGWSQWGAWSTCSLTCGSGVTTRFRRCDSPSPSSTGRDCTGDPLEAKSCNVKRCSENQSAFTARTPSCSGSQSTSSRNLRFTDVITNIGNDYNASTGKFICQYPGIYFFVVSITKIRSDDDNINDLVSVYIDVNGASKVHAKTDPQDDSDNGSYEASATLTIRLSVGDIVNIWGTNSNKMESRSHFSGFLIQSD